MTQTFQNIVLKQNQPLVPSPQIGDRVDVHVRVFEGGKERIQVFQGVVLKKGGSGPSRSFTVRKISNGVGVERTFPLSSPILSKVEVLSKSKVRRAKLYYIRKLKGRASRLTSAFFPTNNNDKTQNLEPPENSPEKPSPKEEPQTPPVKN